MERAKSETLAIEADAGLTEAFHDQWQETPATIKDAKAFVASLSFHTLTRAPLQNSIKARREAIATFPEGGPLFNVLIKSVWNSRQDNGRIIQVTGGLLARMRQKEGDRGPPNRYMFTNHAYGKDYDIVGDGGEVVSRMWDTSKKHDPERVSQDGCPR
ncbi:hypothetical protein F4778DRAFT_796870 [Xylariomycetidae sp. FL2044]|nr:hypothetical protein F4778DRAFT_796870 [Xylariomycetidae sp. FL2044]